MGEPVKPSGPSAERVTPRWRVKERGDDLITYWKSKPRGSNEYAAAEIIEELERELDIAQACARAGAAPCGHSDQYCYSEDGGKNIVCLLCERATRRADPGIGTPRTDAALEHQGATYNDVVKRCENVIAVARHLERELAIAVRTLDARTPASAPSSEALTINDAKLVSVRRQGSWAGPVIACSIRTEDGVVVNMVRERSPAEIGKEIADKLSAPPAAQHTADLERTVEQIIEGYADSYRLMTGPVESESVRFDLLNNIMPQVVRAISSARSAIAPKRDKDGFPILDAASWNAAIERCAEIARTCRGVQDCAREIEAAIQSHKATGTKSATALTWRPHTELPKESEPTSCVLAFISDEGELEATLAGLYLWRGGKFIEEDCGHVAKPPFFWVYERELTASVPVPSRPPEGAST